MSDKWKNFFVICGYVLFFVGIVLLSKVIIEAILGSDLPDWLKIMLLRS